MSTEGLIREAIKGHEVLRVIYYGGSRPGALRYITPLSLRKGNLRARCHSSNALKSFRLEKIRVVNAEEETTTVEWAPHEKPAPRYKSVEELLENERHRLTDLGWHVAERKDGLSLHRRFKNGKPMKGADISLHYEEFSYDLVVALDGELLEENVRRRTRPWTIRGKRRSTRTFGTLDGAADMLIEWARSLSPDAQNILGDRYE